MERNALPNAERPRRQRSVKLNVHPAAIGKTSRIETYLHQPWNTPKARKPSALATSSTGSVFHRMVINGGGTAKSNRTM